MKMGLGALGARCGGAQAGPVVSLKGGQLEGVGTAGMGYFFLTEEDKRNKINPVLCLKDLKTKAVYCSMVPGKGTTQDDYAAVAVVAQLEEWGYSEMDIILKSDNEEAIKSVKKAIRKLRKPHHLMTLRPYNSQRQSLTAVPS